MDTHAPSLEDWEDLYKAARDFRDCKPWTWMSDRDVFGVRNPQTEEIGYCCIMGQMEEVFALAVYLGPEGLEGYLKVQSEEIDVEDPEVMHIQKCLMASFEDRNCLEKEDYKTIKKLGLKFRGRNAWPLFRSFSPGYVPWFLTKQEARFLTLALQQATNVSLRFKGDRNLLTPTDEDLFLVRVPEVKDDTREWKDAWLEPPVAEKEDFEVDAIDELRIHRIKKNLTEKKGTWEIDFFYFPGAVEEGARPHFPRTLVIVDYSNAIVLHTWLAPPWEFFSGFHESLLDFVEVHGILPKRILVSKDENLKMLEPITRILDVKLDMVEILEAVEEFKQHIYARFYGEPEDFIS